MRQPSLPPNSQTDKEQAWGLRAGARRVVGGDELPEDRQAGGDRASLLQVAVCAVAGAARAPNGEFADAAYRFGHSQVRQTYRVQRGGEELELFSDLIGFRTVQAARVIDWGLLFEIPGQPPHLRARPIDGCLPPALLSLPPAITGELQDGDYESLAVRPAAWGGHGPSGEAVARFVGEQPLRSDQVGLGAFGWSGETPLWYYLLKEAEACEAGERLGPVGSLIVGEVLLGIVDGDPESFRSVQPSWRPTLPGRSPGNFTIADLLVAPSAEQAPLKSAHLRPVRWEGLAMMFGTIARYSVKPGHDKDLTADMERFEESPPEGWLHHTVFRSTANPNEIWLSVVFDSEESYKKNADSPEMDREYRRMMEHLESEPEWHDGHVIHEGMRKS